jgi:transketolase
VRDAFINELTLIARRDPSVFLVVGDLGFNVVEDFASEFPDRFLNAGVAEQTMIGLAAGLASTGYKVFVYSIGNFPTMRCLEQIRNDVCYHNRSVTVVSVGAGFSYGYLGYTHHAIEDVAIMRALPRMQVLSPADPVEARALTRFAAESDGPKYLRLGKNGEPVLHTGMLGADIPSALPLAEGSDITILATGSIVGVALGASEQLRSEGISARVVSVPRVKPLDSSVLDATDGTKGILTLEEHSVIGGLGSAVLEAAAFARLRTPIFPIGVPENTMGLYVGSSEFLRSQNGLDVRAVCASARQMVSAFA